MKLQHQRLLTLERHIRRVENQANILSRRSDRYVRIRVAVFALGALLSAGAFLMDGSGLFWGVAATTGLVFVIVVALHRRVNMSLERHLLWLSHQRAQTARSRLDWAGIPTPIVAQPDKQHPFALDLDLIGERSLHHLLNTAISVEGSQRLANWLVEPHPDIQIIARRQRLVRELIPMTAFRNRLALNSQPTADNSHQPLHVTPILAAAPSHGEMGQVRRVLILSSVLSVLTISLFALDILGFLPMFWGLTWPLYALVFILNTGKIKTLFDTAFTVESTLRRLRRVFMQLERWHYPDDMALRQLCAPFLEPARRPSDLLKRITRILAGASLQGNFFLWLPVNLILPWDFYFAYRLRQCQVELGMHAPVWLNVLYEIEALSALANYGYLNPSNTFPHLTTRDGDVPFRATQLGHPLIPIETRVCNDVAIAHIGDIAMITGSNMSGKSSFLRTAGVNMCLAFAGGPVCAASLETRIFRLFTSIAVSDSVIDGISYFYAEVKRLKRLLDALRAGHETPLFFLIDEIFRGTNNRERLIGSRAYVYALVRQYGVGIISTHDLELARLADDTAPITNYHFEEHLSEGRMVFDYRLRPGPSPSTNALRIMQLEGLPIDDPA